MTCPARAAAQTSFHITRCAPCAPRRLCGVPRQWRRWATSCRWLNCSAQQLCADNLSGQRSIKGSCASAGYWWWAHGWGRPAHPERACWCCSWTAIRLCLHVTTPQPPTRCPLAGSRRLPGGRGGWGRCCGEAPHAHHVPRSVSPRGVRSARAHPCSSCGAGCRNQAPRSLLRRCDISHDQTSLLAAGADPGGRLHPPQVRSAHSGVQPAGAAARRPAAPLLCQRGRSHSEDTQVQVGWAVELGRAAPAGFAAWLRRQG